MPTSLTNSRTQQEHWYLKAARAHARAERRPPAMRMRKLNVPPRTKPTPARRQQPTAPTTKDSDWELTDYAEAERSRLLFEAAWRLNDQDKENARREWGSASAGSVGIRQRQQSPPAGGAVARPVSMPVPSARKRSSSPSYDPPCKKALSYDHPIVNARPAKGPAGSQSDSQEGSSSGSQRSPLSSQRRLGSPLVNGGPRRSPLSNGGPAVVSPMEVGDGSSLSTPVHRRPRLSPRYDRPCVGRSDQTADQKMQKALNIRPSLMKSKGRTMTDRLKNSKLLHDVVLSASPIVLSPSAPPADDDIFFSDVDPVFAGLLHPPDSFLVDDGIINGPFVDREETVSFLSSHEAEEPCEPHAIGFYNPGNLCWMNSVVQCVISLAPLMGDIQDHMADTADQPAAATKYSNVLRGLIKILSVRRQGVASRVNDALRKFHKSLEALKPQFATDTQQDCPEFLTELLDHLRDEFYRLSRSGGAKLREISGNAVATGARDDTPNAVRDNTEVSMRQQKTCVSCSEMVVGEIREPILIVDVPDMPKCSLQHALKGYFKSADIERQCDSCSAKTSRTTTAINRLPRVLTIQLKRYICKERTPESTFSGIEKVNSRVRIPEWLSVQDISTDDVQLPSVRVSSTAPTPLPVYLDESSNQEDREFEEAKLRSMEASEDAEDEQLRRALAASMLDAPRSLPGSVANTPVKDGSTPVKEDEPSHSRDYRLVAFIQHMGINPNSGHYTSSVYNFPRGCWMNYNDADVEQQTFEAATGDRAQKNGYIFFYLHRGQFEAQAAAEGGDTG